MPPASLSTFAVMMPGPTTEISSARCAHRERKGRTPPEGVARATARDSPMEHLLQDVVDGDDAHDLAVLVLDGEREKVVLGSQLGHLARIVIGAQRRGMLVHQRQDVAV